MLCASGTGAAVPSPSDRDGSGALGEEGVHQVQQLVGRALEDRDAT